MTVERIVLPGISDDTQRTLNMLHEQLEAKAPRNLLRVAYYDGKHVIRRVGTVIPPQYYRLGMVLGWTAKAVDSLARRCNLDDIVWPGGDLDSLGFAEFAEANDFSAATDQALTSSFIHAVSFGINTTGGNGEPTSMLHFKDALNATGTWNSRARRLDDLLSVTGRDEDGHMNDFALYLDNLTITAKKTGGKWEWEPKEHSWGVPAEPIVYKPVLGRRPFGGSRISRPLMGHQDAAARALVRLEGHMDVYAYPEFWLLGANEGMFKNADGSTKSVYDIMLGRIKGLPDDPDADNQRADVKHFPAASPEPHLARLNAAAKMFARDASLPDSALAITDMSNPTSADSYTASREDLISEAEGATDGFTAPIRRLVKRGLAMQQGLREVPKTWAIEPKWRNPMYLSRAQAADAGAKQIGAVPWLAETEVGLELLGLDKQQASRALKERQRSQGRAILNRLTAPTDVNPA